MGLWNYNVPPQTRPYLKMATPPFQFQRGRRPKAFLSFGEGKVLLDSVPGQLKAVASFPSSRI